MLLGAPRRGCREYSKRYTAHSQLTSEVVMFMRSAVRGAWRALTMLVAMAVVPMALAQSGADAQWVAGTNYYVLSPAQPTAVPAGKIDICSIDVPMRAIPTAAATGH